jgi:hypothetical protein
MTAAGASSLQIARNGLGASNSRLRAEVERALASSYGWIAKHFDQYPRGSRHYYYTLYSLEKVGDLGQIEKFGDHDWYVEGARELLARQQKNGSWGAYTDTSFALLFLTRATRLNTVAAPRIITRAQGSGDSRVNPDLVYISRLGGFISARAVLSMLAESRNGDLVAVGQEVIQNYRRDLAGEVVPFLLALWTGRPDRVTRFAREALEEITGERSSKPEPYLEWHRRYLEIRKLEDQPRVDARQLARLLEETENRVLKSRIIDLAHRQGLQSLFSELLEELDIDSPTYRRKVHGILVLWSGQDFQAPAEDTPAAWESTAARWRRWWEENQGTFAVRRQVAELLAKIDAASGPAAAQLVEELARLGEPAVPFIRAEMRRDDYSFHLIEALERITKTSVGLRP